jgi:hypothetical protein
MTEGLLWSEGRGMYAPNATVGVGQANTSFWDLEGRCFRTPGQWDKRVDGRANSGQGYDDTYTLPCTFPGSMPFARLVDQLVFITELQEL